MINIGFFLGENDEHWNGGINYYNNLFLILKNSGIYKPIVFTSKKSRKTFEKKLLDNVEIKGIIAVAPVLQSPSGRRLGRPSRTRRRGCHRDYGIHQYVIPT